MALMCSKINTFGNNSIQSIFGCCQRRVLEAHVPVERSRRKCFYASKSSLTPKRVGVIGAGPAGLCAARHLLSKPNINVTIFERSETVGGTWVYNECTGKNKYGLPVLNSMYKDLRTNFPIECMSFPDYTYRKQNKSYVPSQDVLQYLKDYANDFQIYPHVEFSHNVKQVTPVNEGWKVTVIDLPNNKEKELNFDAVMVCIGPYNKPVYPKIEGMDKFRGQQFHSQYFRTVDGFRNKKVLVLGTGPSGLEITQLLSKVADKVYLSYHRKMYEGSKFPENVTIKPVVQNFKDGSANFFDGTTENIDVVIYCTGYAHDYPFLTKECGITVDQYVRPLFKHMINIEFPTMSIIGLPTYSPFMLTLDYQVRFFVKTVTGEVVLPSRDEMLEDLKNDILERKASKQTEKDFHRLWRDRTDRYFKDLSTLGKLDPVAPVQLTMFADALIRAVKDFHNFRKAVYTVVNDEKFEVVENTGL